MDFIVEVGNQCLSGLLSLYPLLRAQSSPSTLYGLLSKVPLTISCPSCRIVLAPVAFFPWFSFRLLPQIVAVVPLLRGSWVLLLEAQSIVDPGFLVVLAAVDFAAVDSAPDFVVAAVVDLLLAVVADLVAVVGLRFRRWDPTGLVLAVAAAVLAVVVAVRL